MYLTYDKCQELCSGRCYESKKIANNTYLKRYDDHFSIRLHDHPIIKIYKDKWVLSSCGWQTNTTKQRLNEFSPIKIWQQNYQWYYKGINDPWDPSLKREFIDPLVITDVDLFISDLKNLPSH